MPQIKPFKAIYYNPEKVSDVSKVVCPPYDVISPDEQLRYHNLHPFNFIHVLLGLDKPKDNRYDNRYTRAKATFEDWLKKSILIEEEKPQIYFYKQDFIIRGQKFSRLGFISLMRLQDIKEGNHIHPHENTHSSAKEDRLRLMRNVKSNLSPIFVCYSDWEKRVEKIFYQKVCSTQPFIHLDDSEGVTHSLWRCDDVAAITEIKNYLGEQQLFIADGHHRYEVALEYRRTKLRNKKKSNGQEPFNFIMTYFTNMDSRDLVILPIHRIVKKIKIKPTLLDEFFRTDRIKTKEDLQIMLAKAGQNENAFGIYSKDGLYLLRLKNRLLIDQHIHEGCKEFRNLDATILKSFIFDRCGVSPDDIKYSKDLDETMSTVDEKLADACFIMNPVKIKNLKAIALNGERMPPKTTYFYPKVLSGMTIHRIDS